MEHSTHFSVVFKGGNMKLIIGLGNPGEQYVKTRHNVGFMIVDHYCKKNNIAFQSSKFKAEIGKYGNTLFVKPMTYMNLSGEAVQAIISYYKIQLEDILVIYDDLDLEVGKIRIRKDGSAGGQNGMKNIIALLKTTQIQRVRVGISKNKLINIADYVLGKFNDEQLPLIQSVVENSTRWIDDFIKHDIEYIMNRYNKK